MWGSGDRGTTPAARGHRFTYRIYMNRARPMDHLSVDCARSGHEWVRGRCQDCGSVRTHFAVPAREMLLDEPLVCPAYGALTLDGIAVTNHDEIHLIVRTVTARAYFGADAEAVAQRSILLIAALHRSPQPPRPTAEVEILAWLASCWELALAEIADAGAWFCPSVALPGGLRWDGSGPGSARAVADLVIATRDAQRTYRRTEGRIAAWATHDAQADAVLAALRREGND